jgi:hypothetical protein
VRRRSTAGLRARLPERIGTHSCAALRGRVDRAIRSTPFAQRAERARALDAAVSWYDWTCERRASNLLARAASAPTSDDALVDALVRIAARAGGRRPPERARRADSALDGSSRSTRSRPELPGRECRRALRHQLGREALSLADPLELDRHGVHAVLQLPDLGASRRRP